VTPDEIIERVASGLGAGAVCELSQGTVTVTVPPDAWWAALAFAHADLGCDFFDWLSAVDEGAVEEGAVDEGAVGESTVDGLDAHLAVTAHVYSLAGRHHLLLRTMVGPGAPALPTATGIYRGAAWHERETHEMFGVAFTGHPGLEPLLLPEGFEGHPLRKDFVLAARVAKDWPGAKDPGDRGGAVRGGRRLPPPGVPEGWRPG
jgi:NADH-quinone oxidoreductase subunit C